jgi:WD40 repeat protein
VEIDVVFSPQDGRLIATTDKDVTVRLWDASTGDLRAELVHDSMIWSLAFSPDGKYLATGSLDRIARLWDTTSGQEVARFIHEDSLVLVDFSPDGHYLATASEKGTVRLWFWQQEDLIDEACSRLYRDFTLEEWSHYFGDDPYRRTCSNLPSLDQ